jgi:hypothetical protein
MLNKISINVAKLIILLVSLLELLFFQTNQVDYMDFFYQKTCIFY